MSQSYRKPYCGIACSGEARGERDDKRRANRKLRRVNKTRVQEAGRTEDHEPSRPYKGKKSIETWTFRKDGKIAIDPECCRDKFHFKRLARGKVRMVK